MVFDNGVSVKKMTMMVNRTMARIRTTVAVSALAIGIIGCSDDRMEYDYPETFGKHPQYGDERDEQGSIFGPGGLPLFGGKNKQQQGLAVPIPVNVYLWRATLDTVSFMPLSSADPFGGVVITDWFMPPESSGERFKMTVYILSRELRADGLKVAVFRQLRDTTGNWVDGPVSASTASQLENAILTRAREMRIAGIAQ